MLNILLVSVRRERIKAFAEALFSDTEVNLDQVTSGAEALRMVRTGSTQMVIVDSALPDTEPLDLVREIISTNAMVNTAIVNLLSDENFHDKSEGLGVLRRLPPAPEAKDSSALLQQLRGVPGLVCMGPTS